MRNQTRNTSNNTGWIGTVRSFFSSSWALVTLIGLVAICLCIGFVGFTIFLAYGFPSKPPQSLSIQYPSKSSIAWLEDELVSIEAEDMEGAFMALGVVHASSYPWQMYLWRQTALGSLTQWFGPNLSDIDRFSKRLRFSSLAQESYQQLSPEYTALLNAYSAGINAAFLESKQLQQDELTLLNITPEPWQPWHTLALERLFAWLSVDIRSQTKDSLGLPRPEWESILEDDSALKQWLQLHGFQHSIAGTWPIDTLSSRTVFHRLAYGSSAIPMFQDVMLKVGRAQEIHAASIPGTTLFPSGQSSNSSWFILPSSTGEIAIQPGSLTATTTHERIRSRDGFEVLLTLQNYPGWLLPGTNQTPMDSLEGFSWKGFNPGSDLPAYLRLFNGELPEFALWDGHGLLTTGSEWSILGNPPFIHPLKSGILIGGTSWSRYQASRLNALLVEPSTSDPAYWPQDCHNDWAEEQATFLLEEYLLRRISFDDEYSDALTYLRNWDFAYTPSSIGAIIFDSWLQELPDSLYQKVIQKNLTPSDTLARTYLQKSIASLKQEFGPDLSKWRLDITKPIHRYYPAWNADSLYSTKKTPLSETLFAPLSFPGRGHASTLCWGSFRSTDELEISARWESWATYRDVQFTFHVRRHDASNTFLGRYLIANTPSSTYTYNQELNTVSTTQINLTN